MTESAAYGAEEEQLLALTSARPWDAGLRLQLGSLQASLLKYPEAAQSLRRAIVLAPDDPRPWIEYATILVHLHEGEQSTDPAFHRAAKLCALDSGILTRVIDFFYKDDKPDIALHYLQALLSANPAASPKVQLRYVATLRDVGRTQEAQTTARTIVASLTSMVESLSGVQQERLLVHRARLLAAVGLEDELEACLADCARRFAGRQFGFDSQPGVLPKSGARIELLAAQLRGKDVFLFSPGPSAQAFVDEAAAFKDWDFVAAAIAGHVDMIEDVMLKPIGRHADLLFMSNPAHLRCGEDSIIRMIERGPGIRLLTQSYAFRGYPRFDDFLRRFDDRMLWVNCGDDPPLPSAPLEFLSGNSLSSLVPLVAYGRPARIFLIGSDGGEPATRADRKAYFYVPDAPAGGEAQRNESYDKSEVMPLNRVSVDDAHRRYRLEAKEADEIMSFTLRLLRTIFHIELPEIFNCCPHSTHSAFQKISIRDALEMKPRLHCV